MTGEEARNDLPSVFARGVSPEAISVPQSSPPPRLPRLRLAMTGERRLAMTMKELMCH